jgi:2'-5' RNA ligase
VERLFVSLDLPPAIKEAAGKVQVRLRETQTHVIWTRPEGMHLTLKFLGDVEESRLGEVQAGLASLNFRPITVLLEGLGGFPALRAPKVIWIGIKEPTGELIELQKRVDGVLARLGFPPESRDFHPHLTLGRVKSHQGSDTQPRALTALDPVRLGEWKLDELNLMRSRLRPGGSVYTKLWTMKAAV